MNRGTKISIVVAILILLCGGTGFAYRAGWLWETAEQKKVEELKQQLQTQFKDQKSAMPRPQFFDSIRKQVADLPQQYQQQFRDSARNMFMNEMERRADEYLKMSPPERRKELDKRIAEMEQMRKQFEQRRKEQAASGTAVAQNGGGAASGGPGAASGGPGATSGGPPTAAPGAGPPGGGPPPNGPRGGPFGGPPGGGGLSGILDNTSPAFRAKMSVFMRDMENRRKELGLPVMGPPGPR